jgi:RNA polymerase sigma-70 factor (ECF subfamily)
MSPDDAPEALLEQAMDGDRSALGRLLALHADRLGRMARVRMGPQLLGRVGVSDVLQDVHVEALERFHEFAQQREMPFFVWLRFLTFQRIAALYRRHYGAQRRDVRREVRLDHAGRTTARPAVMAAQLTGGLTSPSMAVARDEAEQDLRRAIEELSELDREVLCLRHFERLTNAEVAHELGIDVSAASKRYLRALARLRSTLERLGLAPG